MEKKISRKSLKDISWQVSEEEYRNDSALSYSTLAKYEREGFEKIDKLFDEVKSPSLTFGSAVDAIITGGQKEFDDNFIVIDFPEISESLVQIAKILYDSYHDIYEHMVDIPDSILADVGKECGYYTGDKYANYRVKMIKENCTHYYNLLAQSEGKQIISKNAYVDVENAVKALKTSSATGWFFKDSNPFEAEERYYQLKFKMTEPISQIDFRCMADLLIVDHNQKIVIPVDLKTSSHAEWDFFKSFVNWNYQIQARLYWRIIRANMDKDDYFKNFRLINYIFVVVNKRTLTPLYWDFPRTQAEGTIKLGKNQQIELRDPYAIAKELKYYLDNKPTVPLRIETASSNDLIDWINKL